jgi:BlaI family transcriptional regulator, penicillinase repressor
MMEALWEHGQFSIREIREEIPAPSRSAYTTVYRMEGKGLVRWVKKVENVHVFEAVIRREVAQRRLIDDVLSYFCGRSPPRMAHLIESGKLWLADVKQAEKRLSSHPRKGEWPWIRLYRGPGWFRFSIIWGSRRCSQRGSGGWRGRCGRMQRACGTGCRWRHR